MKHNPLQVFEDHESEVRSYVRSFPTVFDSELFNEEGDAYLDFFSGAGALNYGHNHPKLKQRLVEYLLTDGITHSLDLATSAKRSFIERFQEVVLKPRRLEYKMLFPGRRLPRDDDRRACDYLQSDEAERRGTRASPRPHDALRRR